MLNRFIDWAEKENWSMQKSTIKIFLPEQITNRYKIPIEWQSFIEKIVSAEITL